MIAVDPVTGAVAGWLLGQVGAAGRSGLGRLLRGERQQGALRHVVRDAVEAATADIADGAVVCAALLLDSPDVKQVEVVDVLELRTALAERVRLTVEMLAEQGYVFDAESLTEALARQVVVGIQADAVRDGPLAPLAEFLRHQQVVAELRGVRGEIDRLGRGERVGSSAGREVQHGGLPGVVEHFTGRRALVEELLARVETHDRGCLVAAAYVIDGMPGVGKTAFVIHAAHVLVDRYSDGAMFVDLLGFTGPRPLSVSQALDELLAQAGVSRTRIPGEDGPKQALWRRVMRGRRALIVLDNARDAGQVEPLLPQAAGCLVLVTARSKLYDLDVTPLPLALLTADEARSLFTAVAGADRCHDGASVDRIVTGCHWLPLAVRLMAGRVRHGDPIEDVADDVEELSAVKKIRGLFDLSYDSLDADVRRAVRLLGVYPGIDITAEVMAALADTSPTGGRRLLRGLAMHNLIDRLTEQTGEHTRERTAGSRYRPHDLLRDYARSRAEADEPSATRAAALDRLAVHYMAMVTAADQHHKGAVQSSPGTAGPKFGDTAQANAWLVAERANLLACIDAASTPPAGLPATTGRLLERLCHWPEAAHCYQRAYTIAQQIGDRSGEADALRGLATVDWMFGRYESAQEHSEQALTICRETGNRSGQAYALRGLAEVDRVLGRYESAREHSEQALTICREIGDRAGEVSSLWGLAKVDLRLGRHDSAREGFEQALTICREIGDQASEADALQGLAEVDLRLGRYNSAREGFEQALTICRDLGDQFGEAYALWGLGQIAEAIADADAAGERWREALQIFEMLQIPFAETVRDTLAGLD